MQVSHVCEAILDQWGCSNKAMRAEEGEHGLYYRDDFNDAPWACKLGTTEEDGIWMNTSDQAGTIMALMVWVLLGYSIVTITFLADTGGIPVWLSMFYCILCSLALASHAKTTLTDPGTIPASAVPTEIQRRSDKLSMCSQCQTFKPPFSHHCRICNRCISRMDRKFMRGCCFFVGDDYSWTSLPRRFASDHCPWMNNCIGSGNLKHFLLFLFYTWTCSAFSLLLLGWNYFFCATEECIFTVVLTQLVRIMTLLSIGSFLFTSSMLMNVTYGIMTGIGTIDRLKKKAQNAMHTSDEEPIPLTHIFGIAGYHTWPFPIDPVFPDYDLVMGYSTPQRLLREQMKENPGLDNYSIATSVREYMQA
jgi:hypothetical protein